MDKTLLKWIEEEQAKGNHFPEWKIWWYYIQLVWGVVYLNQAKIIHLDLKPDNILINDSTKTLKVADFGTSIQFKDEMASMTPAAGAMLTPLTCAPEVITEGKFGWRLDTWSLGCILFWMATFQHPFGGIETQEERKETMRRIE